MRIIIITFFFIFLTQTHAIHKGQTQTKIPQKKPIPPPPFPAPKPDIAKPQQTSTPLNTTIPTSTVTTTSSPPLKMKSSVKTGPNIKSSPLQNQEPINSNDNTEAKDTNNMRQRTRQELPLKKPDSVIKRTLQELPFRKPEIPFEYLSPPAQVKKCDERHNKSFYQKSEKSRLENSIEYIQYKDACTDNSKNTPLTWEDEGPGDACILQTTLLGAKIFDLDFPLTKCLIITETGDATMGEHFLKEMLSANPGVNPTHHIKIKASEGNGNGLGQITPPAYQSVMELVDPTDLREKEGQKLSRSKFNCAIRSKLNLFFDITNSGKIPNYKMAKELKDLHPLMSIVISLTYLSESVPALLTNKKISHNRDTVRFNSIDSKIKNRRQNQLIYAGEYNSSANVVKYKQKISKCLDDMEANYKKTRDATRTLGEMNEKSSITTDDVSQEASPQ
jgi:hypothetical protein